VGLRRLDNGKWPSTRQKGSTAALSVRLEIAASGAFGGLHGKARRGVQRRVGPTRSRGKAFVTPVGISNRSVPMLSRRLITELPPHGAAPARAPLDGTDPPLSR
jgi:hypothetical protein